MPCGQETANSTRSDGGPFESEAMEMHEANAKVNNVRNNGPELLQLAEHAAESGMLPL